MSTKIYFTADTHFGHKRTLQLSRRPFKNTEEMDNEIISRWNATVTQDDTVYHLGDFGLAQNVWKLNAKEIYLLPGNYDDKDTLHTIQRDPRVIIIPPNTKVGFQAGNSCRRFKLVHEPDEANNPEDYYLFGHIHKLQMIKRNGLNVGVDCHHFFPLSLEDVFFYMTAITQHYDHNVFMDTLGEPQPQPSKCKRCKKQMSAHVKQNPDFCADCATHEEITQLIAIYDKEIL